MDVNKFVKHYFGYELFYFIQPGLWMDDRELITIENALDHINKSSGKNFTYGIFANHQNIQWFREFLSRTNLCVMKLHKEPIGFFYNVIVQEKPKPIMHAGLVVVTKNKGVDLLTAPYIHLAILQRKKYGSYYYTNISSTPSIIGSFSEAVSQVWPSHRSKNLLRPPSKAYYFVLNQLYQEYILRYFSEHEVQVDPKRFIMKSPSQKMGFETNLRNLPRHKNLAANLFCDYWIDYEKGEDLIQVGRVDFKFYIKGKLLFIYLALKKVLQLRKPFVVKQKFDNLPSGSE